MPVGLFEVSAVCGVGLLERCRNGFLLNFAGVAGVLLLTALATVRLEEAKAARLNEFLIDLIRHSPLRYWMRD